VTSAVQGSLGPFNKYREFISLSRAPIAIGAQDAPLGATSLTRHDLIVWPEAPADFATSDPIFRTELSGLARSTETPVIAGSVGVDFDPAAQGGYREYGSAAVFNSAGSYIGRYDKIHRVPWGEYVPYKELFFFAGKLVANVGNMEAGTKHTIFHLDGHNVGIFICYESIFGDEVRQFPLNGAQVLVNISDDGWYGDSGAPWQHLDMARMRAIENHRWLLRDTNTGVTASIDPHGRGDFRTPRHVRAAFAFPFGYLSGTTFYTRHGDWFAWLCGIVTVLLCAAGSARRSSIPARREAGARS
jgi:apolipoprotein N-acyltransferase